MSNSFSQLICFLFLQVRLLTGISRYHEMGYVIELLIEHDQFENLVNKGVEKVCRLFVCKVYIAIP